MSFEELSYIDVKYCPNCRGEFVPRIETCPDCGVRLTYANPAAGDGGSTPAGAEPQEVFTTMEVGLLPLVRAILEDAAIEYRTVERFVSRAVFGSVQRETGVLVAAEDAKRAVAALAELPPIDTEKGPS